MRGTNTNPGISPGFFMRRLSFYRDPLPWAVPRRPVRLLCTAAAIGLTAGALLCLF
jgi:hypothetical protein